MSHPLLAPASDRRRRLPRSIARRFAAAAVTVAVCDPLLAQTPESPAPSEATTGSQPAAGERELLGAPAAIVRRDRPTISLEPGTRIYSEPDPAAPVILRVDVATEAELIDGDRDGGTTERPQDRWRAIRLGGVQGFLPPAGVVPRSPEEIWTTATADDEKLRLERVARLRDRFGAPDRLGSFALYSDLDRRSRQELLDPLDQVAADVPGAYRRRYGVDPSQGAGGEPAAVVLFAALSDYRRYLRDELAMTDPGAAGVSPLGLVVLAAGQRPVEQISTILVHELTHVLNRQAFGLALPPWLEEGMAEDLAYHPLDRAGRLRLGELPEVRRRVRHRFQPDGSSVLETHQLTPPPRLTMACAADRWPAGRGPDVEALTGLTANEFAQASGRADRYAESAILVRYLLDGGGEETARVFRRALARAAEERFFESGSFLQELGDTEALSRSIGAWTRQLTADTRCRDG